MATQHFHDRTFFEPYDVPEIGSVLLPGAPFKMSLTPWSLRRPAPPLGQHNIEVYGEVGLSREDIERLQQQGVM